MYREREIYVYIYIYIGMYIYIYIVMYTSLGTEIGPASRSCSGSKQAVVCSILYHITVCYSIL